MKFFSNFFSVSNEINENTVMGVIFAIVFLVATFTPLVDETKYYVLAGVTAGFWCIAPFKK